MRILKNIVNNNKSNIFAVLLQNIGLKYSNHILNVKKEFSWFSYSYNQVDQFDL